MEKEDIHYGQRVSRVVELLQGTHHPSTAADPSFQAFIEGHAVLNINAGGKTTKPKNAVDGIALSGVHKYVYYCALFSRICIESLRPRWQMRPSSVVNHKKP